MSWNRETYDLIEKYLVGGIKGDELIEFEDRLRSDAEFKEQFDTQKLTRDAIIINGLGNVKRLMDKDLKTRWYRKAWFIILLILIIGAGSWFTYYMVTSKTTGKNLQDTQIEKDQGIINNTSKDQTSREKDKDIAKKKHQNSTGVIPQEQSERKDSQLDSTTNETISKRDTLADPISKTDTTTQKIKNQEAGVTFDCSEVNITSFVTKTDPAYNEEYGTITVSSLIKGGIAPYQFRLNTTDYQGDRDFKNVLPGSYTVITKDAKGCIDTLQSVNIVKDNCRDDYEKSFAPISDYEWQIPSINGKKGTFILYSKGGTKVVAIELSGSPYEMWLGTDRNNSEVPSGFYRFVIEYQDGNVCKGSLSILR